MSRIHEALKKAELERAAAQGGTVESAEMNANPATEYAQPDMSGGTAVSTGSSYATAFSFEALLARCPQGSWHPDPKTMLFFGADEQAYGTEEFRALPVTALSTSRKAGAAQAPDIEFPAERRQIICSGQSAQVMVRQQGRRVLLIDADFAVRNCITTLARRRLPGWRNISVAKSTSSE